MSDNIKEELEKAQKVVVDMAKVKRNHFLLESDKRENVIEHSFSIVMLCWRIFEIARPPLEIEKIFKYSLVHDFLERGIEKDTNTYAQKEEREKKKQREQEELKKLSQEFETFPDLITTIQRYEQRADEEAVFVWSVDKMQAIVLGELDEWRPYREYGVTYEEFCNKIEGFLSESSVYTKEIFKEVFSKARETYYDNPNVKGGK